jgi:hypothetical protein
MTPKQGRKLPNHFRPKPSRLSRSVEYRWNAHLLAWIPNETPRAFFIKGRAASSMSKSFAVLPGFYKLLFLYLEPVSTILPAFLIWFWPGSSWFHRELYPSPWHPYLVAEAAGDPRTKMAIWQLGSCENSYFFSTSLVFDATRARLLSTWNARGVWSPRGSRCIA